MSLYDAEPPESPTSSGWPNVLATGLGVLVGIAVDVLIWLAWAANKRKGAVE